MENYKNNNGKNSVATSYKKPNYVNKSIILGILIFAIFYSCSKDSGDPNSGIDNNILAPCINGFAGIYPCNGYDLLLQMPLSTFNASSGNDSWGWADETTGKEYALVGLDNGTAFVDITNPKEAIYLGLLPTATSNSPWRDIKVYQNHAFIVSEAPFHGMQVFDLTRLRNITNVPQTFTADTYFTDFGSAHNIVINETSGYAYPVGTNRSNTYVGGPLFINIQNPKLPITEGGYGLEGYTHDAQVVTYHGPDTDYSGHEIFIGSNENKVAIVDVTNKINPVTISTITYNNVGYVHQGWFTEDYKYFILGDEDDELSFGNNTRSTVLDLTDLDNPIIHFSYFGPTGAIDHNGYVKGSIFYQANYRAGVRIIDITQIGSKSFTEIGFFDTYPEDNQADFDGAWNVYPFLPSGNIIISDLDRGLFVIRKSNQ